MSYNSCHKSIGRTLTKIIRMTQNIGFTASPERTTITPENIGDTIEKMDHELPTICSGLSNGLFISIVRTYSCISSRNIC